MPIRNLTPADWPAVRRIYEEGIATGEAMFETGAPCCGFRVLGHRERIGRQHGVWRDTLQLEQRSARVGS